MTTEELKKILEEHKMFLNKEEGGKCADLSGADISGANLRCANLKGANLRCANFIGADLSGADLRDANLRCANIRDANLSGANLYSADLSGADLSNANLYGANIRCADLYGANLRDAKNTPFVPLLIPEGECVVYKKVIQYIIKLKLLEDSRRSRATSEKCRCDKALVVEIQNMDGSPSGLTEISSYTYAPITYKVGEIVYADSWDDNRWNECSHGIHFFIDRQSAVDYIL